VREVRIDPGGWDTHVGLAGRPQIVVGGPGTGKTQFLSARVSSAIASGGIPPENILVLGFSRSGATDLRHRLSSILGSPARRIRVTTYHGLAMDLVERHAHELGWAAPPAVLTGAEQEHLVAELLAGEDAARWPSVYRPLLTTEAMASEVTDFILRAHEQGTNAQHLRTSDRAQWKALPDFIDRYNETLVSRGRTDYGRLLTEAAAFVRDSPELVGANQVVIADEFQDTSPVQAELLFGLAANAPDLLVAADPYQSIYSFRGADINNVFAFPSECTERLGAPAERLILTTSFRVPENILSSAVAVTARELPGGAGRVASTRTGGVVACHEFRTSGAEAEWIASDIERVHIVDGVPLERIAVFVRTHTSFVDEVARALERRDMSHTYAEERLTDEPIIRFLHDLVTAASDAEDAPAAMRRVLLGPFVGLPHGLVNSLPADEPDAWPTWLRTRLPDGAVLADLIETTAWADTEPASAGMWRMWSTLPGLEPIATSEEAARDRSAWIAYSQVVDRIGQRAPEMTLFDHVALALSSDFEADPLFSVDSDDAVTIATLHRAKGTEFDAVYIADAVEGHLPDLRAKDSLLGVRHLNPHLPTATSDYITFRLDEERRLAYTAMTRATASVVWTSTAANDDGAGRSPSRFMSLVAPTTAADVDDQPLTPRAFAASIRKLIADPSAPAVDRLAGLRFLTGQRTDSTTVHDPLDRYGVRQRGSHKGVIQNNVTLSPSKATSYATCPRRYLFERHILTHIDESLHMRFGNLIHLVLEETESLAISRGDERGSTEAALDVLETLWGDHGLGDDSVGRAWKVRAADLLADLYANWPSSSTPIALELKLPLLLDGTMWHGRADRVEAAGNDIKIVDYKTGMPTTVADAATSLQLGYYVLAARDNDELADAGTVDGASFWYPRKTTKSAIVTRDLDTSNLSEIEAELVSIGAAIKAEEFPAVVGSHCRRCDVRTSCPAQRVGEEAFVV
jgi:superfamily I DNA/RNA helicase/RecB family exonuclease